MLGVSLGALHPEIVGPAVVDQSGAVHPGITGLPIAVVQAGASEIATVAERGMSDADVTAVGFTDVAQGSRSYDQYQARLGSTPSARIEYRALLVVGDRRSVGRLTGSFPLFRRPDLSVERSVEPSVEPQGVR